jgi:hypothetical protein
MPACFSEQGGSRRRGGASVPQTNGEIQNGCQESRTEKSQAGRMAVQLEKLAKESPLILHTDAGRTFSMVRRMKAEKKMGIPISLRSGFAISTENGKAANAMTEDEWEEFYDALSKHLRRNYPGLYARLFWAQ